VAERDRQRNSPRQRLLRDHPGWEQYSRPPVRERHPVARMAVSIWKQPDCWTTWQVCGRVIGKPEVIRLLPHRRAPHPRDFVFARVSPLFATSGCRPSASLSPTPTPQSSLQTSLDKLITTPVYSFRLALRLASCGAFLFCRAGILAGSFRYQSKFNS